MRRYVPGPGIDEPLVWYEATSGARDRRWFLTDDLGSVIAIVDRFGRPLRINTYGPFGGPNGNNLGRFQFAGREWLPEIGLLHMRNRAYMPGIGRFLQADPIGLDGGMNLYEYAGSSPLARTDPWGLQASRPVESVLVTADGIPDDFDVYGMWWGYWLTRPSDVRNPRELSGGGYWRARSRGLWNRQQTQNYRAPLDNCRTRCIRVWLWPAGRNAILDSSILRPSTTSPRNTYNLKIHNRLSGMPIMPHIIFDIVFDMSDQYGREKYDKFNLDDTAMLIEATKRAASRVLFHYKIILNGAVVTFDGVLLRQAITDLWNNRYFSKMYGSWDWQDDDESLFHIIKRGDTFTFYDSVHHARENISFMSISALDFISIIDERLQALLFIAFYEF